MGSARGLALRRRPQRARREGGEPSQPGCDDTRCNRPPCRATRGAPPNAAPKSTDVPNIAAADVAQYPAQRRSRRRVAEPALSSAAAGMPMKIGIAHRLCSCPWSVGATDTPCAASSGGGKPATGSVTNSPDPINPTPAPKVNTGTNAGPTAGRGLRQTTGRDAVQTAHQNEVGALNPAAAAGRQRTHRVTSPVIARPPGPQHREHTDERGTRHRAAHTVCRPTGTPGPSPPLRDGFPTARAGGCHITRSGHPLREPHPRPRRQVAHGGHRDSATRA